MTTDVVVVFPDMLARDAARLLADRGFTALPVVDTSGALVGVVGETELLRDRLPQDPRKLVHGEPAEPRTQPAGLVDQVMAKPVTVMICSCVRGRWTWTAPPYGRRPAAPSGGRAERAGSRL